MDGAFTVMVWMIMMAGLHFVGLSSILSHKHPLLNVWEPDCDISVQ